MEVQRVTKSKLPPFPMLLLGGTMLITLLTLIWIILNIYHVNQLLNLTIKDSIWATKLHGKILHEDEMLTLTAQMAAMTGNLQWETRYNQYEAELTTAINNAILLIPRHLIADTIQKTDAANSKLVKIEHNVFFLIRKGRLEEAKKAIFSQEYEAQKIEFEKGMHSYGNALDHIVQTEINNVKSQWKITLLIVLFDFVIILTAWFVTLKYIWSWKTELELKIQSEVEYKKDIESARLFLKEILMISKMSDQLQLSQQSSEAYSIVASIAKQVFPGLSGGLCIRPPLTDELETVQSWGDNQCLKKSFLINDCWALREGHVYIVNEVSNAVSCQHFDSIPSGGSICVPLIVQDGVIGMLELNGGPNNPLNDHLQKLAITFCEVLRLSLNNIFLREKLHEQATQDTLTGLFNRRYLDRILPQQLKHAIRNKTNFCVAMLDLDHFKKINDEYGHDAGDEVLRFVGKLINKSIEENDTACRFGGEEFLIIFQCSLQDALPRLEKIAKALRNIHIPYQAENLPIITISIGVAEVSMNAKSQDEIIKLADEALYKAKSLGRDRIEVSTG